MLAVETSDLTRKFGEFTAVNKLNLAIRRGSIYGFLGPNGSGKSTTIRMLCGLLKPTAGTGTVMGLDIGQDSEQIKSQIGYMSQKFSLYDDLTVSENLAFYAGMYDLPADAARRKIQEMLELAHLADSKNELAANLSGGYKQRLALGCAILHKPPILFLDEPTGGVDPKSRRMFWDIIYALADAGSTVMVTTHFMDEAEHCDAIGFIYEGNLIADDSPHKLKMSLPGIFITIPADNPMELMQQLAEERLPALDIYPHGASVRILTEEKTLGYYRRFAYQITSPSLEDVFVYYVKNRRQEAPR
ncbi:MAG: ABC transporter ATP-binding protein [Negativicutes bacterium]|nr:ABC transporter ATP-binding protein [Negativicutes bacterium]